MIDRLVILGMGDVTTRYVVPALGELTAARKLPVDVRVMVVGRHELSSDELREQVTEILGQSDALDPGTRDALADAFSYHRADATDAEALGPLFVDQAPVALYLALPSHVFGPAVEALAQTGVPADSRLLVEKPFGSDTTSARTLNDLAHGAFAEEQIVRIDHFLGLQTAHNVVAVRFANRILEPAWNADHVARVEVVWDETLALEGRAGYYDGAGALRDMVQNHLLQLMCLVAMEPPESLDPADLADAKVAVLRATRPWADDLARCSIRARYTAGTIDGHDIPAYVDEEGVDPAAETETFAEITLAVDTPRWEGVPFTLRTGKALAADRHEVVLHFRPSDEVSFDDGAPSLPNRLRLTIDPDQLALDLRLTAPGDLDDLDAHELVSDLPAPPCGPYALLLRDALEGGRCYSVRDDEVVAQWEVVQPFLDAWAKGEVPLGEYPAGSSGPP